MRSGSGKVAVIVPMFNAEDTIRATLGSVVRQTYKHLEIIVVDDGSWDRSPEIVAEQARRDARIHLVRQANAGVAAARNVGAGATDAELLGFIDADDLWAPHKVQRQLDVIARDQDIVAVYCWFAQISADGRIESIPPQLECRGDVFRTVCRHNLVGNGSSLLVRRKAFEAAGGFDTTLLQSDAQGCEDWLMLLRLSELAKIDVVPAFLVGYRQHRNNMSNDGLRMLRSMRLIVEDYRARYPHYAPELDAHLQDFVAWIAERSARLGSWPIASDFIEQLSPSRLTEVRSAAARGYRFYLRTKLVPQSVRRLLNRSFSSHRKQSPFYLDVFNETS